jgi:hypothetical protein
MVDVLWEFISHRIANFAVRFAVVTIGGGKAPQVRDRFNIPDNDMMRHLCRSIDVFDSP